MARSKKKTAVLSPEDKLQQALVPVEKQPYKVPENWCWTKVGILSDLLRGVSYKKNDAHSEKLENDCLIMRGGNIGEGYIDINADNVYVDLGLVDENQLVKKNDIIIVASTGSTKVIGRAGVSNADYKDVSFGAFLMAVRPSQKSNPLYMDFYFQSDLYRNRIRNLASGVNINNIRTNYIMEQPFPLPPLPEQQRIVDRIESLFAKLDEAKEKAQAVVDGFEDRKAAILHKAFTGELTKKWRKKNQLLSKAWNSVSLKSLCEKIFDGPFGSNLKSDDYVSNGIRVVRLENLKNLWFDDSKKSYVTKAKYDTIAKHTVYPSDIIMSTFIADEVKVCQMPEYIGFAINKADCIGIRLRESLVKQYVLYFLSSKDTFNNLTKQIHGATRPRVNTSQIKNIQIPICSIEEQVEIVHIINETLGREQQAKEAAEQVIDKIDSMKKSILARAFRGELGTNDPNDESAVELLKSVL